MMLQKKSIEEAIALITPGSRVFVHGGAATPNILLAELVNQSPRLKDICLIHLHTEGPALYSEPQFQNIFRVINLFVGHNIRHRLDYDRVDYLPCFHSASLKKFRSCF